jgi:hypothetical protein
MAYITFDDLIMRYPILTKWGINETDVTNHLIFYSEQEVNSRLASHYPVPFTTAPNIIKDVTMDMAYCKATFWKNPDGFEKAWEACMARIEGLKNGDELIITTSGTILQPDESSNIGNQIWTTTDNFHPVFSSLDAESPYSIVSSEQRVSDINERS